MVQFCLGVLMLGFESFSKTPYEPQVNPAEYEQWRWSLFPELRGKQTRCFELDLDGSVWFGLKGKVARYDGQSWKYYGEEEGVPDELIFAIKKCKNGDIFATTDFGIYAYEDGRWIKKYSTSKNIAWGKQILEDQYGNVWFSGGRELVCYDGQEFRGNEISKGELSSLQLDIYGDLWCLDPWNLSIYQCKISDEGKLLSIRNHQPVSGGKVGFLYSDILASSEGEIWFANESISTDVKIYDIATETWRSVDPIPNTRFDSRIAWLLESSDGSIWAAGPESLLIGREDRWDLIKYEDLGYISFSAAIDEDQSGNLWFVGENQIPCRLEKNNTHWETFKNIIFCTDDDRGNHWFLSIDGRVVLKDSRNEWFCYGPSDGVIDMPHNIFTTPTGETWVIGANDEGAAVSVFRANRWEQIDLSKYALGIAHYAHEVTQDGRILLGSGSHQIHAPHLPGGLIQITRKGDQFEVSNVEGFPDDDGEWSIPGFPCRIWGIEEIENGKYWLSGRNLYVFDGQKAEPMWEHKWALEGWIDHIHLDMDGVLWLAKWGVGVFRMGEDSTVRYTLENGLSGDNVYFVNSDAEGNIWVLGDKGVNRFDGTQWVSSEALNLGMDYRGSSTVHFSNDGYVWFNTFSSTWKTRYSPEHEVSSFDEISFSTIRHKPDLDGPETVITYSREQNPHKADVSFKWVGSDSWNRTKRSDIKYSYRMDEGPWSLYTDDTQKSFSNLSIGKHRFEVRSRDLDLNIDPSPAIVEFEILAPLWRKPWFIYLALSVTMLILVLVVAIVWLRWKHVLEMEEVKLQFFTNISHELRTPLMVILGPIERVLRSSKSDENKQQLTLAHRNANRLLKLVDQLLDFRKLEFGKIDPSPSNFDVVIFMKEIIRNHQEIAREKRHNLVFECAVEEKWISFDGDILQKVVDNLVSNAVKYTPDGGTIQVRLEIRPNEQGKTDIFKDLLHLVVTDNGIGISKKHQRHIFDPFFREKADYSIARGAGIGLSLTKEMIELSMGNIQVQSPVFVSEDERPGSRFIVEIPVEEGEVQEKEGVTGHAPITNENQEALVESHKPILLMADDDADIRDYLMLEFSGEYEVLQAPDGTQALQMAKTNVPDIMILDVMMPGMNGVELCKALKTDEITNHIPIILLTARRSDQHQFEGLDAGADDYVVKPAQMPLIRARLKNLLENRRLLQKKYSNLQESELPNTPVDDPNLKFLERVNSNILDSISEFDYRPVDLARLLGISERTLNRKLKAITDHTPSNYIRDYKIRHAASLLRGSFESISNVAYDIGFLDLSYFSQCFKKLHGCTPTEYASKHGRKAS